MKHRSITTDFEELSYGELTAAEQALVDRARAFARQAYAPYSHFRVGASILLDNGETVCGANQENVAYPSGTCAERSACFSAGARFPGVPFKAIAIASIATDGTEPAVPTAPCGACRQALLEYEMLAGAPVKVLLAGRDTIYRIPSVASLLPLAFTEF